MTYVLIFALYAATFSDTDFASLQKQEFTSQESCETAKKLFLENFGTTRSINTNAICVKK